MIRNTTRFLGGDYKKIPRTQWPEFINEIEKINFNRSRVFAAVLFLLDIVLIYTDISGRQKGLWEVVPGYELLFYMHLVLAGGMLGLLLVAGLIDFELLNSRNWQKYYGFIFSFFMLMLSAAISDIDQLIHGDITVFILGSLGIAVINYFRPVTSFFIYGTSFALFLIGITCFQSSEEILRGHYINGSVLVAVSWFLSGMLYNMRVDDFLHKKTIEQKTRELEGANRDLKKTNEQLEESLRALDESQNMILTLALALESKDPYTHGHSKRVAEYSLQLARYLGLSEKEQKTLWRAAILHDIGKIGIPDAILNKAGSLTQDEWLVMSSHPERGENICSKLNFAKDILPIIRHHHERYDGKGYPDRLRGEDIPYLARIIAIADAVDAITSYRAYRPQRNWSAAIEELRKGAGSQFDPDLVEVFLELYEKGLDQKEEAAASLFSDRIDQAKS